MALVERLHEETGEPLDPVARSAAIAPLLEGSPYGAVYLLGPRKAPVGYMVISFGWDLALGGPSTWIEDIYVRQNVRGRGIASEALTSLGRSLAQAGVKVIQTCIRADTSALVQQMFERAGYVPREDDGIWRRAL